MANWAAIGALGTAAEGAGNYFGQLNAQKIREERLAQARGEKLADRAHSEKRADDATEVAKEDARLAGIADEEQRQLERREGKSDSSDLRATILAERQGAAVSARELAVSQEQADHDRDQGRLGEEIDRVWTDPKTGEIFEIMKDGSDRSTGRFNLPDEDYVDPDAPPEDRGRVADMKELSEASMKIEYQRAGAQAGFDDMLQAMKDGYEPTDWVRGNWDKLVIQSDLTNEFASGQGQLFQRGATQLYENLLRRATGAAAPDTEVDRYAEMFIPRPGDHESVVTAKLRASGLMIDALKGPAWDGKTSTNNKQQWMSLARDVVQNAGLDELQDGYDNTKPNAYGAPIKQPADEASAIGGGGQGARNAGRVRLSKEEFLKQRGG